MDHIELGKWGEDIACSYVEDKGWRILDRNVTFPRGELDIVAIDKEELVVVEVRTRSVGVVMSPEQSVGPQKICRLVRTGRSYVQEASWNGPWRIDIVGITVNNGRYSLRHTEDITSGMGYM